MTNTICDFISDVALPSSEIADACAYDINDLLCNVVFPSIRGINPLSLSLERTLSEGAAYFIYSLG